MLVMYTNRKIALTAFLGAVTAQWIRPQTLKPKISSLNLAAAVVPLGMARDFILIGWSFGKGLCPTCKAIGPDCSLIHL